MIYYTTGEIYRYRLLKKRNSKPFHDKSEVAKLVRSLNPSKQANKHGGSLCLSSDQILAYNEQIDGIANQ